MKHLFAPWRLEYITGKKPPGCIFCKLPSEGGKERDNLILHVGELAFVIMNRFPYNSGHLLVAPRRHTADLTDLSEDENREIAALLQRCVEVLQKASHPEGFNLGLNLGQAAGAGIRDHLHWHIVPRWHGDTNFTAVLADLRSIPQHLLETWDALHPLFQGLQRQSGHGHEPGGQKRLAP